MSKVTGGRDTPPPLKMRVERGSGGLENPLSHGSSDGGVTCCSKRKRGVMVGRKPLCLAFQAREGFVVGMISFHLLETQEGHGGWKNPPPCIFEQTRGPRRGRLCRINRDSMQEEGSSLIVSKCVVLDYCVSR